MKHYAYHILSDHHNTFCDCIEDVKKSTEQWEKEGDEHIKIYRICTEDFDSDEIILDEELISLDEIRTN